MTTAARSEQQWVRWLSRQTARTASESIVAGIGDDCAVFRPAAGEDLVFTTDMLIEDVHFERTTHSAAEIGHKALARGLSDVAAMGGVPRFCLLSLAVPPWANDRWLQEFYRGLIRLARRTNAPLIGGDLSHASQLACDITVVGAVARGQAIRRDGARPGDQLYVSGRLGSSALGFATRTGTAWKKHRQPQPRLALGQSLKLWHATAAMDLSDGLSLDLQRLARASGLSAVVERVPKAAGATADQALHGGEDYELLFAVPPGTEVPKSFAGSRLTCIGRMQDGPPGQVFWQGQPLPARGYDHFVHQYAKQSEPPQSSARS